MRQQATARGQGRPPPPGAGRAGAADSRGAGCRGHGGGRPPRRSSAGAGAAGDRGRDGEAARPGSTRWVYFGKRTTMRKWAVWPPFPMRRAIGTRRCVQHARS